MKKFLLCCGIVLGLGFVMFFAFWIEHYQNVLTVFFGSTDPIDVVVNGFNFTTLDESRAYLLSQGYGKGIQHFIRDQILMNPFSIGMMICFLGVFGIFVSYVVYIHISQKRKEEEICQALEKEENIAGNKIVSKAMAMRKKYQMQVRSLVLDQDSQNQELENIAHQMKSTLSTILLNIDQVDSSKNEEEIYTIVNQVDRCNEMLNRFLQSHEVRSNLSNYHYEVKNIADCLRTAIQRVSLYCERKNLKIQVDLIDCVMSLDVFWVQEAIETLLLNAVEFAYKDTKLQVKMEQKENRILIHIINEGKEPKDIHSIFMRYGTSHKQGEHFGIGLHMVKTICKNHLGDVYAFYASNQMHFLLDFPLNRLESIQYTVHE